MYLLFVLVGFDFEVGGEVENRREARGEVYCEGRDVEDEEEVDAGDEVDEVDEEDKVDVLFTPVIVVPVVPVDNAVAADPPVSAPVPCVLPFPFLPAISALTIAVIPPINGKMTDPSGSPNRGTHAKACSAQSLAGASMAPRMESERVIRMGTWMTRGVRRVISGWVECFLCRSIWCAASWMISFKGIM